ncbi:MAG: PAS domain S-box protein [Campylobacterota bacterium]|nr:PAS domain S-box protein [Campylobacterota bacterium]
MSLPSTDKSNQILKEIINNSWSGIGIIDQKSKFIYVNDAFTPILGYSSEELLKISFESLLLSKYKKEFQELLVHNNKNEYTNNIQVACERKDKQIVYLDISIKLMSNNQNIVININDVTKNISDHEIFDKYVIQFHIECDGILNEVSEAFCRLTMFNSEELLGKSYLKFLTLENRENLEKDILEDIVKQKQWTGILSGINKHQDRFWVDVIIKPIKNKYGDTTGYSAVMFDITSEINLQKNTEVLKETIVDNESKLKIMSDTMRTVAHEWRQPLNSISLDAQNLLVTYNIMNDIPSKDEAVPVLESIQKNTEGLSGIINKFQYITELRGDKKEVSLNAVINKAINDSIVKVENLTTSMLDKNILTYEEQLVASMVTILNNAQEVVDKLTNEKDKYIDIKVYEANDSINIDISNNGGNIEGELIEKIFTPYFSTKETKNGVGLSLYIAKMVVEFHLKGKIEVINKENNIVVFKIILPIEQY